MTGETSSNDMHRFAMHVSILRVIGKDTFVLLLVVAKNICGNSCIFLMLMMHVCASICVFTVDADVGFILRWRLVVTKRASRY